MRRCGLLFLATLGLTCVGVRPAEAIKELKDGFIALYGDNDALKNLIEKKNCNVCHYGKTKRNRNDYGQAISKHISKDRISELKQNKDAQSKAIRIALEAAAKEMKEGELTFGDLLKEGKPPGTDPPDAE